MKKSLLLLISGLVFSALSANAADLSGHVLSCSVNLQKTYGGIQDTGVIDAAERPEPFAPKLLSAAS